MADAGVTGVLSKLGEVASAEATALIEVDDQIRELHRRLVYLQALVRGADQQRRGRASELLLLWARETREVAFEVEDAVDEFHLKVEAFQVKLKWGRSWYHSALKLINGLPMQIMARHGLSREITKINGRIKEIGEIKDTYKIETSSSEIWSASSVGAADVDWDIDADNVIQLREKEFETLKGYILEKQSTIEHRAVISIVGPSGMGKTTLARKLYNDRCVREHFKVHAWISLPARIRFDKYLEMLYKQVSKQVPAEDVTSDDVQYKLEKLLKKHDYLVVLDGLVDTSDWNSLVRLLPDDSPKSRILLTTQVKVKEIKPSVKQTTPSVVLQPLFIGSTGTKIEKLLCRRGSAGYGFNASLRSEFGKRALEISAGLPLAIVVLCGLLRTKASYAEWDQAFQQLETQPTVRGVWDLSFGELPYDLKSCFLYFAMASDNILLDPDRLVRLWVAEGFVVPKKGRTLEEVGMGYLKELISRGLVQAVKDGRGGIKYVTVHSLLYAFAESEAQESGFFEMHHHANILNPQAARRLALHNYVDSHVDIPDHFPKLRSLFCDFFEEDQKQGDGGGSEHQQGGWADWFLRACGGSESPAISRLHDLRFIRGSRFLRVIDLYGLLVTRVPDEIGAMIHLRYLGIRNCELPVLPASVSKLDNLQTLDVRATQVQNVTDEFWEIQGLRHVLAGGLPLSSCPPADARLRHLQTLVGVVPTWRGMSCCHLDYMISLRSLAMSLIREQHVPALSQALQKMELLVSLSLSGDLLPSSVFANRSSRRLEVLVLDGRLDTDHEHSDPFFLPSLGMLSLHRSSVKQDFVDKVAMLPNLAEVELLDGSYSGAHLVFPAEGLTKLKLLNLAQLESVLVPRSTLLTSCDCPLLQVEHLQQVSAREPAQDQTCIPREKEMLSGHQEPEFEDELHYIYQENQQGAAGGPREDEMLVRRGKEGPEDMEHLHDFSVGDPREDGMLVRRGTERPKDMKHLHDFSVGDPREDGMLVRRGTERPKDMKHLHDFSVGDPREDGMLVRRGTERPKDMKHLHDFSVGDPREDGMLVRRGTERPKDMKHLHDFSVGDPREDGMLVRRGTERPEDMVTLHYDAAADDSREDEMLLRLGMEGSENMEHLQDISAYDPREDEMLVRRGTKRHGTPP